MSLVDLMPGMSSGKNTSDTMLFDLWEIGEGASLFGSLVSLDSSKREDLIIHIVTYLT